MSSSETVLVNNHRQDGWFAVAVIATVFETVFFALRVYCRQKTKVGWGADDYLTAVGYVACIALNGVGMAITTDTWVGQHTAQVQAVDPESVTLFLKLQLPLALSYLLAAILPKCAMIALFLRVFSIRRGFRIACWVVLTVLILYLIAGLASVLASCQPFSANWKLPGTLDAGEHCIDITSQYKAGSYPNVVTDVAIIILPIPVVWGIKKSTTERLCLLCTFCLGLVGLAFSIARLDAFFSVFDEYDILWSAAFTGIFTTLEPASYFLVACMMTFRQLLPLSCCGARTKSYATSALSGPTEASKADGSKSRLSRQRHSLMRLTSGETAIGSDPSPHVQQPPKAGVAVRDEEWELSHTSADSDKQAAAQRLGAAHNRSIYPGVAVVSTVHRNGSDFSLDLPLHPTESGGHSASQLQQVREARAIGVKREVDVSRS